MILQQAKQIAEALRREMEPHCHRIEIAGSVRRDKPNVKDIELVVIPGWVERSRGSDLFGELRFQNNQLHEWALMQAASGAVRWIKAGTGEIEIAIPKPDGKYWRGLLPEGIKLDLFITTPECWGCIFTIRTGSADFSHALVKYAQTIGLRFKEGRLMRDDKPLDTAEEADVFAALGLQYVEPQLRSDASAIKVQR